MTRAIEPAVPQFTARAKLNELFNSPVVGRPHSGLTRGAAWQAGQPMPASNQETALHRAAKQRAEACTRRA